MNSAAQPAPANDTPTPVRVMVTADNNPTAFAAIQSLNAQPAAFEERAEEIKKRATAELTALRDEFQAKHKAAWQTIETALGLDPERNHSVCTQHVEDHGIAFVRDTDEDDDDDVPGPLKALMGGGAGGLGAMIANALGGRVVQEGPNGGVIEVKVGDDD